MNAYDIIKKPVISEKSREGITQRRYTFYVDIRANKTQIKQAVESIFGVEVEKINTARVRGKLKIQGRNRGYTSDRKKAIVKLTSTSKTIEFFDSLT